MKLNDKEQAMLAGEMGPAVRWALEHQMQVGRMFDAADMVEVHLNEVDGKDAVLILRR